MAKTTIEEDPVVKLKRDLKIMVKAILEDEDLNNNININGVSNNNNNNSASSSSLMDAIDRAKELLTALKELKGVKKTTSFRVDDHCPPQFCCPLSKLIMKDPVIISTGQTYDRPFIQKWLKAGHRACPLTQQALSHTLLTPNYLVRDMISQWCKTRGINIPNPIGYILEDGDGPTEDDRVHFLSLLNKMSKSVPEQKAAAKELRLLTKRMPCFRALFGDSAEAIYQLVKPLMARVRSRSSEIHQDLQEDVITTLLNISIHDSNKKRVAETPMVISLLIDALKWGTPETRSNAAAALFTLSALDSNKVLIGKSGALKPLIDLLDEGHPLAMKDAASAIFNLCIIPENKARAVGDGVVKVLLKKIKDGVHVDELLAILAILSTNQRAVEEMAELEAVPSLLSITRSSSCARNKENSVAILYTICANDRTKLTEMREEERGYNTLSKLAKDGTSRAKRKASGILERLNRAFNVTHTA